MDVTLHLGSWLIPAGLTLVIGALVLAVTGIQTRPRTAVAAAVGGIMDLIVWLIGAVLALAVWLIWSLFQ